MSSEPYNDYLEDLERTAFKLAKEVAALHSQIADAEARIVALGRQLEKAEYDFRMAVGDLPADTREPDFDVPAGICF